ncbi:MAG: hypothetical protein FRC54_08715 [bacterium LCO1.1]|uniref:Uncharacterized protein n=1 Tax=Candidatus Weimeria bifida TaxID=2599074 RepID=A0A6N7J038_9FIRM|nr:hypothetical protein [Candidatus Weimeria bifida]
MSCEFRTRWEIPVEESEKHRSCEEKQAVPGWFIWDYIDQAIETKDRYGIHNMDMAEILTTGRMMGVSGDGICYASDRRPTSKCRK